MLHDRMNIPQMEEASTIDVLVVDDDLTIRRLHQTLLNRYGLENEAVNNGKEAVDLFTAGRTFDLVLMDMEMPVMDGPEVANIILYKLNTYMHTIFFSCIIHKHIQKITNVYIYI